MHSLRSVRPLLLVLAALAVSACGAAQALHDGTVSVAKRTFTTPIPTMDLDIVNHADDESGPAIVRVYQLTSSRAFDALSDAQWLTNDLSTLKADVLATSDRVLSPGAGGSVRAPMHEKAQVVGVVALMHNDDAKPMRLLIPRKQWTKTYPVQLDLDHDALRLHQPT